MKNVRKRHRLWLSAGGLALGAVVAAVFAATAVARPSATPLKIAIMSDCQGAFAANYEQDIGGAITVYGEVLHPGRYGIQEGERLSSILKRAGGFLPEAYPTAAALDREQVKQVAAAAEEARGANKL